MNGKVLLERNADDVRPIASISKLVVAAHSAQLDPTELITITKGDVKAGHMKSTPLQIGHAYTRHQLEELALIPSDNVAAIALGRSVPDNVSLYATIVEPSGLNPLNTSSARQLAEMAKALYQTDIAELSTHPKAEIGDRRSTNPLLTKEGWLFYLSKTGFINSSGGCLVVITEINNEVVTVVILGARNTHERWQDLIEIRRSLGDTGFYVPIKVKAVTKTRSKRKR
jgi:D-alanyl-D-alanine endopeptidase (penicillin-binding protein 7)